MRDFVIKTKTTVSLDEIAQCLDKGQKLLADLAIEAGYASLYHLEDQAPCIRTQLYLYLYAIQSWDITTNAMNYFPQMQLIVLMSRVEQLFYICKVKKMC